MCIATKDKASAFRREEQKKSSVLPLPSEPGSSLPRGRNRQKWHDQSECRLLCLSIGSVFCYSFCPHANAVS